jgi:GT2 family glycosyltransferase
VDDGGTVESARALGDLERRFAWLRVVRNARNQGFIASCNRGAEEARGEVMVFLNDDTIPLPGWYHALLRTFRAHPDAGVVGGRLVYPDGRLQEAGGVIFRDGSGANFGRNDFEPDAPLYTHVRRVHYCSGALLATPRDLFQSLGGFDANYRPAYYEDTDYCFSVRASGRAVYYQPESVVVHLEGATSGTDPNSGVKRHQARNRQTFRTKWREALAAYPEPPSRYSGVVWQHLAWSGGDAP